MGSNGQTLLYDLSTLVTFLAREARVHLDDLMSGTCSLGFKNIEERAPTGVQDALRKSMVLDHVENTQFLNSDHPIVCCILLRDLIVKVTALTGDLEMRLRRATGGLTVAFTSFLAAAQHALFASQSFLRPAIEARIVNGIALTIGQERLQAHINTDVRMLAGARKMLMVWFSLTDDQDVPMGIGPMHQVNGFRSALKGPVQLDLEGLAQLGRNDEVFVVLMQIAVFPILSQLDGVPAVRLLEAREPDLLPQLFEGEIPFQGFTETISKTLNGGGWYMLPATSFEASSEIILPRECTHVLILGFDGLQHLIVQDARLCQTLHEQMALFFIWVYPVLICSHEHILANSLEYAKLLPAGMAI